MKPRLTCYRTRLDALKWRCASLEPRTYGTHVKQGCGYTPLEAYQRWKRCY